VGEPSSTSAPSTSSVTSTTGRTDTGTTGAVTTSTRTDGCRGESVSDPLVQEIVADVNGNSSTDRIQTHRGPPKPALVLGESVVQVAFDDGLYSAPALVETTDLLGAADLDGDGRAEIFVANEGNTARAGGVLRVQGCAVSRVLHAGQPFSYLYFGTGLGCAPACYPNVDCLRINAGIELVVSNAQRASGEPGSSNVPPLTDDLVFAWTLERYQLRDGVMVSVDSRQGTARHADLPVPKRQGFNCAAGI
jgi:hypothetical protein